MTYGGSAVVRRQLGAKLKQLREAADKRVSDVAVARLGSKAKMSRIETGKQPVSVQSVVALCRFYGADEETTTALAKQAEWTQDKDWWEPSPGVVPRWFDLYPGLEATASRIRCFEPQFVPGLQQTEMYARAMLGADYRVSPEVVEQRVRFRVERQQRSWEGVSVVLGESALRLVIGSDELMDDQLRHLRDSAAEVRVLPISAASAALPHAESFVMLAFDDPDDPSVVYVEGADVARYLDKARDWADHDRAWCNIVDRAVPMREWAP
jgi:transcriptional regulator with XRE-family HTH domain